MFPHPDMGKDMFEHRQDASNRIRCGWQAAIALAMVMIGAMIFDFAAPATIDAARTTAQLEEK